MDMHISAHPVWQHPGQVRQGRSPERLDRFFSGAVAVVLGTKVLLFLWLVAFLLSGHPAWILP